MQHTVQPSIACVSKQWDLQFAASRYTTTPISHTRPSPCSPWAINSFSILLRMRGWVDLSTLQVSKLLKVACKWSAVRIKSQPESYDSRATTRSCIPTQTVGVSNLPRIVTWWQTSQDSNSWPLDHKSNPLTMSHHATSIKVHAHKTSFISAKLNRVSNQQA